MRLRIYYTNTPGYPVVGKVTRPFINHKILLVMVTVANYSVRTTKDGSSFVTLVLQGDLEMVQSQETGRFYATARTCSISSTFDENTAALLVGKQMPGSIVKEQCDSYEYTIPETGEVVNLSHRYTYSPMEQTVVQQKPANVAPLIPNLNVFSSNGNHVVAEA